MKIGDRVQIINTGETYATYYEVAERMCAKHWVPGNILSSLSYGVIVNSISHPEDWNTKIIYLVRSLFDKDYEILIGDKGLRKINSGELNHRNTTVI